MKILFLFFIFFVTFLSNAQYESIGPVYSAKEKKSETRACSFDSTFIYWTDTINIPIFDDFSKNHFQKYEEDYSSPSLVAEKHYKLLTLEGDKIDTAVRYTSQPTFRRLVNSSTLEVTEEIFPKDTILVTDLCYYPPIYAEVYVYPPFYIIDTVDFVNDPDTVWLPEVEYYQDSATKFFMTVSDQNAFWMEEMATHNYTNAVLPWSLGTVTFDGIDANGLPYNFASNSNEYNDFLTSKPIFLGSLSPSDSVYLSFLYQPQGFNDEAESNDSLVLEFYAPLLNEWERIWSTSGTAMTDFKVFHHKIIETKYLKDGFRFRLKNYGSEAGALDQFHVDYIHLRKFSGFQDTLFKDFAIVYPVKTLLNEYTQVPWDHYKNTTNNIMTPAFEVTVRNGSQVVENNQNGSLTYSYQGTPEGALVLNGQTLSGGDINYQPRTFYTSYHDISANAPFEFDKGKPGDYQEFDVILTASAQFPNFTQNDSTFYKQRFYDAYAYDDGSAEAAYGPEGVINARLAYQIKPLESDSLVGIKMKFVASVFDVSNESFYLTIWNDNNGKPGDVIYEDDYFNPRSPSYTYDDSLGFTTYYLKDTAKLGIDGTFYVGWKQENSMRLNIGMDMNIDHSDKIFYSVDNEASWINTIYPGSLLIRPVFSTALNADLSLQEGIKKEQDFVVYPNPTEGIFYIRTAETDDLNYDIYNIQGKHILSSNGKEIDLSSYDSGIYFVKKASCSKTVRLIKK